VGDGGRDGEVFGDVAAGLDLGDEDEGAELRGAEDGRDGVGARGVVKTTRARVYSTR
jgi:hypothetical protein